jgi:hypothetical protein
MMGRVYRYRVVFRNNEKIVSIYVHSSCVGNAKAIAWMMLEDDHGTRSGWSMTAYWVV